MERLARALSDGARAVAAGIAALVLLLAGLALLLAAAWVLIAGRLGPAAASAVLGGACLLLAALALLLGRPRRPAAPPPGPADPLRAELERAGLRVPGDGSFPPLLEAFVFGLMMALRLRGGGGERR